MVELTNEKQKCNEFMKKETEKCYSFMSKSDERKIPVFCQDNIHKNQFYLNDFINAKKGL